MSTGMVICSVCKREVHQDGPSNISRGWQHCEDGSPRCEGASSDYPRRASDVRGAYCCADGPLPFSAGEKGTPR